MHRCHTLERHNIYECLILNVASLEELNELDSYIKLSHAYEKSNEIRDNPYCIKRHSRVSQYWEAMSGRTLNRQLHSIMEVKSAQMMQKSSTYVLVACLLLIVYLSFKF